MQKQPHNWITKARIIKTRPALPTPGTQGGPSPQASMTARLTALLRGTLKAGAVRINAKDLPIKLKSLRTQVFTIAKKEKAISHVLAAGDGTISMWLEPRKPGKRTTARPNNGRAQQARTRAPRMTSKTKPQASTAKPIVAPQEQAPISGQMANNPLGGPENRRRRSDLEDDPANAPESGTMVNTPAPQPVLT